MATQIAKQLPTDLWDYISKNAGILLDDFNPSTWTVNRDKIKGATTGGINFTDVPTYTDYGEDIDNCPNNMMELKQLDQHVVTASGTYVSVKPAELKNLAAVADIEVDESTSVATITPRNNLNTTDFQSIWFLCDYGVGGAIAIRLDNVLNTGGFALQTTDNGKGQYSFTYTAHYSIEDPDTVPYEVFIKPSVE